ncbi:YkoF family thiamine/hydroxymethylpyrimidine-binding protein [Teredinibacter purpureus]|uniref:YkoF family thiamine/hydroxymethylpyrimidine-binding protein n=1 Tax=Teredinibacter purpureus TaxID=2731756 RepID=UPI0005F7F96E|nr:YkoF family thiamine/hydroxymethylpyrimidine-binding protein [Teredinibacter purpureus]
MKLSVELTLYPLQNDYLPIIVETIEKLNTYEGVDVNTVPTATILAGEYSAVMFAINDVIAWSFNRYGKCVFVAKFLPGYEAL